MTRPALFRAGAAVAAPFVLLADVSEYQPDVADAAYLGWSKAIAVRALYGAQHDDAAWYGGQRRAQLHSGGVRFLAIYQYLVAGQSGAAQAEAFHSLVGAIQPGEVFVADFEEGSKPMLTDWYNTMRSLYGPSVAPYLWTYSGLDFGEQQDVLPVEWLADYTSAEPSVPHKLWQFTSSFQVPGVGTADCSRFSGTIDQLAALAYPASPPPDWVFSAVRSLTVKPGRTSVELSFCSPGTPEPLGVGSYEITVRENGEDVPSYPRAIPKGPNPEVWQGGSLKPGTQYQALVRAIATDGGHASPWAAVTFKTSG